MLSSNIKEYFEACRVPTSGFDINYAANNSFWMAVIKAFYEIHTIHQAPNPKIIHFIWVGCEIPGWYINNINNWRKHFPDYEFILWRDKEANDLMDKSYNRLWYSRAENFGMRSDLLRYEILYQYGGLYMDTDFVCVNPELLRAAHENYSFYSSAMLDRDLLITNGFIGCQKNHQILEHVIDSITFRMRAFDGVTCPYTKILHQTGPHAITSSVLQNLNNDVKIFPSSSIFPFPGALRNDNLSLDQIKSFFHGNTMACHLWHTSWQGETKGYLGEVESFTRI
jgi:mannosyltransferase OCH1-like enzyme